MEKNVKRVVDSWLVIEYLSTGKLPYPNDQKPLYHGAQTSLENFAKVKKGNKSFIYFGIYRLYKMEELIRNFFNDDSEIFNEDKSLNYSVSIQIDDTGRYIEKSIFIPQIQFLLKEILSSEFGVASLERLSKATQRALDTLEVEVMTIFNTGVSYEALESVQKLIKNQFKTYGIIDTEIFTLIDRSPQNEPVEVNSMIVSDLETILSSESQSSILNKYIKGEDKFESIDENSELINRLLEIDNLPDGRWPSNNNFKLSLMQQVAVNLILNEKKDIFSVNGPPGTGKTTLLKDVFSNLIIERAQNMTKFKTPTMAKVHKGKYNLNGFTIHQYELDDSLKGYGIVVASSNNGAVENISKDLPKNEQIIHNADYFLESDDSFSKMIKNVNLYPEYVSYMFETEPKKNETGPFSEHWGLFSAPMGRRANINSVMDVLLTDIKLKDGSIVPSLYKKLKSEKFVSSEWETACHAFIETQKMIKKEKTKIKKHVELVALSHYFSEKNGKYEKEIIEIELVLKDLVKEQELVEVDIRKVKEKRSLLPKVAWYIKLVRIVTGKNDPLLERYSQQLLSLIDQNESRDKIIRKTVADKEKLEKEKLLSDAELVLNEKVLKKLAPHFVDDEYTLMDSEMWLKNNYNQRQISVPWITKRLNYLRGKYFIQALGIHKIFNRANASMFYSAFTVINKRKELNLNSSEHRKLLRDSWSVFHLFIPVVSTTFASLGNMYQGMGVGSIDYLFIDEAGQATPQAAAGGIWRANHVVAVGDPSQIEPVMTLDESLFSTVRKAYNLDERYLSKTASVQSLADNANQYGMIKPNGDRIGTPLWVHRRCLNPMFHVSNEISYDGKMVQGAISQKADSGILTWLDIKGDVKSKQYVEEQSKALLDRIQFVKSLDNIYVISPFKAVVDQTKDYIQEHSADFKHVSSNKVITWSKKAIGTVHTFQGKEEDIVYFICGTDETTDSAANWSCQKANLLNVAITRAKKEFIIIGDYSRFKTKPNYHTIAKYAQASECESKTFF